MQNADAKAQVILRPYHEPDNTQVSDFSCTTQGYEME
jgi:hypothetical protein